jgi:hypothetical protein
MMKRISYFFLSLAMAVTAGVVSSSCTKLDNPVDPGNPADPGNTPTQVSELKAQLQGSYLYYPIIVNDVMCGAMSFNLAPAGKPSRMGLFSTPDWEKIDMDLKLHVDSIDIDWDVVPKYEGFKDQGIVSDALRITMKLGDNQSNDIYYPIGSMNNDSVVFLLPSEMGPQDIMMTRFDNKENISVTDLTSSIGLLTGAVLNSMVKFVSENKDELTSMTDEMRMEFLAENGYDDLTDWVYDFDSYNASARTRQVSGAAALAADSKGIDYANWMKSIRDDVKVRDMVIPGSHDAGTYGIIGVLRAFGQTQMLNIDQQWNAGVRVFDLRVRDELSSIRLFHNFIPCNKFLSTVAKDIADLLRRHPSEGAIIILKGEDNDTGNEYAEMIRRVLQAGMLGLASVDLIFSTSPLHEEYAITQSHSILDSNCPLATYSPDMTMGDLRGKVLVINRSYADKKPTNGAYASKWEDNQKLSSYDGRLSASLRVQDHYGEGSEGPENYQADKEKQFVELWDASEKTADNATWYVHGASGYVWDHGLQPLPNYYLIAQNLYPKFITKVSAHLGRGIVLQDFSGIDKGTRDYEQAVKAYVAVKHTFKTAVKVVDNAMTETRKVVKEYATKVVDKVSDITRSFWKRIRGWFGARSYAPNGVQAAPKRILGVDYEMHGDELLKQCIDNNFRYGDRTK